ncbi:MAG: hypothetical protein HOF95_10535, partial [Rhodospirillales bacterium]|nr:hypothetical protein [Rhodospirillales bacterium]
MSEKTETEAETTGKTGDKTGAKPQPWDASEYKTFAGRMDVRVMRSLLPFLWSANGFELRLRVVIALSLLLVAIAANVGVPIVYKQAVDALTPGAGMAIALPLAMIGAYGLLRLVSTASGEIRDA